MTDSSSCPHCGAPRVAGLECPRCGVIYSRAHQRSAQALICFAGDGGCFVFGSLLMATFFARTESALVRGWLRWGFLVIGACAFADTFATWFGALRDVDQIPFGEIEEVGLSDPSRLTQWYGWSIHAMVHRYLVLAALGGVGLGAAYWARRLVPGPRFPA